MKVGDWVEVIVHKCSPGRNGKVICGRIYLKDGEKFWFNASFLSDPHYKGKDFWVPDPNSWESEKIIELEADNG